MIDPELAGIAPEVKEEPVKEKQQEAERKQQTLNKFRNSCDNPNKVQAVIL